MISYITSHRERVITTAAVGAPTLPLPFHHSLPLPATYSVSGLCTEAAESDQLLLYVGQISVVSSYEANDMFSCMIRNVKTIRFLPSLVLSLWYVFIRREKEGARTRVVLRQFRFLRNHDSDTLTSFWHFAGIGIGIGAKRN